MKTAGIILIIIGLFLMLIIGSNIYCDMYPTNALVKALCKTSQEREECRELFNWIAPTKRYTYSPPFSTHETINMSIMLLGIISFLSGISLHKSASKQKKQAEKN